MIDGTVGLDNEDDDDNDSENDDDDNDSENDLMTNRSNCRNRSCSSSLSTR